MARRPLSAARWLAAPAWGVALALVLPARQAEPVPDDVARDRKVLAEVKDHGEALANLTYLCDEIGPRLTGSKNLRRANEWAAEKMRGYGLSDVRQEAWEMPEGWERGPASARLLEPDTGRTLSVASYGWTAGTPGKIEADVVVLKANNSRELQEYKGKLKGAIVLTRPPAQTLPADDLEKPANPGAPDPGPRRPFGEARAFLKEVNEMLAAEGAAAVLSDAGKPYGLLVTTGGWNGKDRPSAANRVPRLFVAHHDYAMLYRLASRPAPARTRLELDVRNTFVPGPVAVYNTVGEIRGGDKADEIVVVGAHLDSWDLGQGATDNGTGTVVVLEAARALSRSGVRPRRTIRFVLFTGEEQGLHGSAAYVERHKEEMARVSACLAHDTGTGKVTGIDARHRPVLQPLLAKELVSLKDLGVTAFDTPFIGGSDHASFERVGVPGLLVRQEGSGYRLNHHTQLDTIDRALEPNLVQGAQVLAVTSLRLANRDGLLPRDKAAAREQPPEE
jgi:carboxypeptidase Q